MTFLLFVASVVVLEYLLRDVRQKSGSLPESSAIKTLAGYDLLGADETSTTDLLSLERALGGEKASKTPDPEHATKQA